MNMLKARIIPCLLMENGRLVKTRKFREPKYVGDPLNAVKIYNEKEVDELILLDIGAWRRSNGPNYNLLEKVAVESRMPLCYGGGITSAEQAINIINMGFEKISISRSAILNPETITNIASRVGSQSVVVTLDIMKRKRSNKYSIYIENGKRPTKLQLTEMCFIIEESGAGEIVINNINLEGEMKGFDLKLARMVADSVSIPVTFIGGAGSTGDMAKLIDEVGVVGVGAGSMFVFKGPFRAVLISYDRPEKLN